MNSHNAKLVSSLQNAESNLKIEKETSVKKLEALELQISRQAQENENLAASLKKSQADCEIEIERSRCLDEQLKVLTSKGFSSTVELSRNVEKIGQLEDALDKSQMQLKQKSTQKAFLEQKTVKMGLKCNF